MKTFWKNIWDKKGKSNSTDILYLCGWEHLDIEIDSKQIVNTIIKEMNIQEDDSILDIGCSAGFLSRDFQKYNYTGVDYSEPLIEKHKTLFPDHNVKVAEANSLPYESNSFNKVFCSGVFQYLPDEQYAFDVIDEMKRVAIDSIMLVDLKSKVTNDKHFVFSKDTLKQNRFVFSKCMYIDDDMRYNAYYKMGS